MRKFCGFLRSFFKSSLKRRFGTAVPTYFDKLKSTAMPCFLCALNVGASAPNPDTRNFSRKVSWNFKSFHPNKLVCSVRSSLAHLSPKERCVLLLTFLSRKVSYFLLGFFVRFFATEKPNFPMRLPSA